MVALEHHAPDPLLGAPPPCSHRPSRLPPIAHRGFIIDPLRIDRIPLHCGAIRSSSISRATAPPIRSSSIPHLSITPPPATGTPHTRRPPILHANNVACKEDKRLLASRLHLDGDS
uniref:Uncharacterized protein n=1 Tax=Oryza meridionalis TaxID=40149 RepID=A0A0E0D212_9ORYZ